MHPFSGDKSGYASASFSGFFGRPTFRLPIANSSASLIRLVCPTLTADSRPSATNCCTRPTETPSLSATCLEQGRRLVDCNCKGGQRGLVCKHAAAALIMRIRGKKAAYRTLSVEHKARRVIGARVAPYPHERKARKMVTFAASGPGRGPSPKVFTRLTARCG